MSENTASATDLDDNPTSSNDNEASKSREVAAAIAEPVEAPSPATDTKASFKFGQMIGGSVNLATNGNAIFVNLGGPNVKFKWNDLFLGVSFYPSLQLRPGSVVPTLGAGPFAGYRFIQISVPFYMIEGRLKPTFGLGFVF